MIHRCTSWNWSEDRVEPKFVAADGAVGRWLMLAPGLALLEEVVGRPWTRPLATAISTCKGRNGLTGYIYAKISLPRPVADFTFAFMVRRDLTTCSRGLSFTAKLTAQGVWPFCVVFRTACVTHPTHACVVAKPFDNPTAPHQRRPLFVVCDYLQDPFWS